MGASPREVFAAATNVVTHAEAETKDARSLLRYYLTYPCADVVKLNYLGDGAISIFSERLDDMDTLNRLLSFTVARSRGHPPEVLSMLSNYESLCTVIQHNQKTTPNTYQDTTEIENKSLSLHELYELCVAAVDEEHCVHFLRAA